MMNAMKVAMLLCDAAQEVGGKLYVLGGGWSVKGPEPAPMAFALKIDVPWSEANRQHHFTLALESEDGHPVELPSGEGMAPVRVDGEFEVGRPPGLAPGADIDAALAVSLPPLPLAPGRYAWQLTIDGSAPDDWRRSFTVRPA